MFFDTSYFDVNICEVSLLVKFKSEGLPLFLNNAVLVSWYSQHSYTTSLDFMCSSYQCK